MGPKSTSLVWNYFLKENANFAKCNLCSKKILTKNENTNGLLSHIKLGHPIDNIEFGKLYGVSLKLKEAIISLSMRNGEFSASCPSFNQCKLIEGAVEILQPFRETTQIWSSEKVPTINTVSERLFTMTTYLKIFIKNKNKYRYGITFARTLLTCTEEPFPDCGTESIENSAANFLSPHYMGIHFTLFARFDSTNYTLMKVYNKRNLDGKLNYKGPFTNYII